MRNPILLGRPRIQRADQPSGGSHDEPDHARGIESAGVRPSLIVDSDLGADVSTIECEDCHALAAPVPKSDQ